MGADSSASGGRKGSSPAKQSEGRTSSLLAGLPSRGNFTGSDIASSMARRPQGLSLPSRHSSSRNAARNLDGKNPSKRPNIGSSAGSSAHEESSAGFSELTLQSFTDELIARLREASGHRILLGIAEEHSEYLAVRTSNCHVWNFGDVSDLPKFYTGTDRDMRSF
nr:unnamed protein product [Digitaria exilis]